MYILYIQNTNCLLLVVTLYDMTLMPVPRCFKFQNARSNNLQYTAL